MNYEKISVIVPVYNVEKYLEKCVQSIINQTYSNLEIILVDDGAMDRSGEICDELAKRDNRIVVVHKKNGGLSSARNTGLDVATGKYIGFVDSDDWIECKMYDEMYRFMIENNCDLVECGVNQIIKNKMVPLKEEGCLVLEGKEALKMQLNQVGANFMPRIAVWSKLYKASFWENRRFPDGKIHEDYMLTCEALYLANKVGLIKAGLYNHLADNMTSIVNSKFGKKDLFLEVQYRERMLYLEEKNELELTKLAKKQYYYNILTLFWKCSLSSMEEDSYYQKIIKKDINEIKQVVSAKYMKQFYLAAYMPKVYIVFRRIVQVVKNIRGK